MSLGQAADAFLLDALGQMTLQDDAETRVRVEKQLVLAATRSKEAMQLSATECHQVSLLFFAAQEKKESMSTLREEEVEAFAMDCHDMYLMYFDAKEKMEYMFQLHKEKVDELAAFRRQ